MSKAQAKAHVLKEASEIRDEEAYEEAQSKIWLGRKRNNGHDPDDPRDPENEPLEAGS